MSLFTMITGARLQQPRQETVSSVNARSGVVSPSPTCRWSWSALVIALYRLFPMNPPWPLNVYFAVHCPSLYAIRPIETDDQVSFDYAMVLHGPTIPYRYEFECHCGSPRCRQRVTADDWQIPELQSRYRGFFQQYLQEKIDRLTGQ